MSNTYDNTEPLHAVDHVDEIQVETNKIQGLTAMMRAVGHQQGAFEDLRAICRGFGYVAEIIGGSAKAIDEHVEKLYGMTKDTKDA